MADQLMCWAITEREFLRQEIKGFKAGSKLLSPSGDNITAKKLEELQARLEHVLLALEGVED